MDWVYFKDSLCKTDSVRVSLSNRAFRYADGLFESVRLYEQVPMFWSIHYTRLMHSLDVFGIELGMSEGELKDAVKATAVKNNLGKHGRLKITVYRDGAGKYFPETNQGVLLLEVQALDDTPYIKPVARKKAIIFSDLKLPAHALGNYKGLNKTLHVIAAVQAQKKRCQDALLLNDQGVLAEAVSSSLFGYRNYELITPPLSDGGLNGSIRKVLINEQEVFGLKIVERSIQPSEMAEFEEVWTTNAGAGISAIVQLDGYRYQDKIANEIQVKLEGIAINSCSDFLETQT